MTYTDRMRRTPTIADMPLDPAIWYGFNTIDVVTGEVRYSLYDSQVLLDWILEPVPEECFWRNGSIHVELPEGFFSRNNILYTDLDNVRDYGSKTSLILGGADPLRAKAKSIVSITYVVDRETFKAACLPDYRSFYLTNTKVKNREPS